MTKVYCGVNIKLQEKIAHVFCQQQSCKGLWSLMTNLMTNSCLRCTNRVQVTDSWSPSLDFHESGLLALAVYGGGAKRVSQQNEPSIYYQARRSRTTAVYAVSTQLFCPKTATGRWNCPSETLTTLGQFRCWPVSRYLCLRVRFSAICCASNVCGRHKLGCKVIWWAVEWSLSSNLPGIWKNVIKSCCWSWWRTERKW